MSVALDPELPEGLLENLIVEDIAPSKGALSPEFQGYIQGMKAVDAAKVKSRKEARDILSKWEKVLVLLSRRGPCSYILGPICVAIPAHQSGSTPASRARTLQDSLAYPGGVY